MTARLERKAAMTATSPRAGELAAGLRLLALEALEVSGSCPLIVNAERWDRTAAQLRFLATLVGNNPCEQVLDTARAYLTAGRTLLELTTSGAYVEQVSHRRQRIGDSIRRSTDWAIPVDPRDLHPLDAQTAARGVL